MFPGDDPAAADLKVAELPSSHLVVEQVAGQAGDLGCLVDGIGEPVFHRLGGAGGGHVLLLTSDLVPSLASRAVSNWVTLSASGHVEHAAERMIVLVARSPRRSAEDS